MNRIGNDDVIIASKAFRSMNLTCIFAYRFDLADFAASTKLLSHQLSNNLRLHVAYLIQPNVINWDEFDTSRIISKIESRFGKYQFVIIGRCSASIFV